MEVYIRVDNGIFTTVTVLSIAFYIWWVQKKIQTKIQKLQERLDEWETPVIPEI